MASVAGPLAEIGIAYLWGPGMTAGIAYWIVYYLVWGGILLGICRLAVSTTVTWTRRLDRVTDWVGRRPFAACLLLLVATVGLRVIQGATYIFAFRVNSPEQFAAWRMFGLYGNQFVNLLLITGVAYWIFRHTGRQRQTAD